MMASGENLVNEERSMNKEPSSPCACSGGNGQQTACASEQASTETTVFHVSNMDCRNEEALVRRTLEGMPGVERLLFDLPQRLLTISHREVSADALEQALNSVGMKAQAVRDAAVSTTYRIENMDCPSEEKLIRSHLGAVEGIQDLDFDLAERTLSVKHLAQARAQMEQVLQQMLRQLPSKTEMPDLIIDISQTALSSGLTNELFEPEQEQIKEFYAEKPIKLRMVGSYHQFGAFVSGVASLPRVVILTMHDINLKPKEKTGGNVRSGALELSGTVKTYRYLDETEVQAQQAADAGKEGKK